MVKRKLKLRHVSGKPAKGSLYGRQIVFTHIPKTAGTTLDWIMAGIAEHRSEEIFRASGTLYGQFLGDGKVEATAILLATPPETVSRARFLDGHISYDSVGRNRY